MLTSKQQTNNNPSTTQLIQSHISLANKNWFGTGGNARHYCEPKTTTEFQQALIFADENKYALFILGQGANILISDEGFDGLVIRPNLDEIEIQNTTNEYTLVKVGAGVIMSDLIETCLKNNLIGLEEFSGIPGTVGGSVYINLHYFEFLLAQFLVSGEIINKKTGSIHTVDTTWFNFGYNDSTLQKKDHFLVTATFKLKKTSDYETAFAQGRRAEIIRHREKRYPQKNTCGSFFRNFLDNEVAHVLNEKKLIFVAYYLDKIGVKGTLRIGDAIVSHQHANMIVNAGQATSTEIITLARRMQELVKEKFDIIPQPECQLIGFKEYPLIR